MKIMLLRIAALLIVGLASVSSAAVPPAQKQRVDLPMLFRGTSPAVNVRVNGKGPFLFLIDTGAQGRGRADASLVRELGLAPVGETTGGDGSGRNDRTLQEVLIKRLSVGGLEFRDIRTPSRNYNTSAKVAPIAGILGFNLFADHLLTLDFVNKRVRIEKGALPPPDGKTILSYEAPYDTPIIEMVMGGLRLVADIDSGDTNSITFPETLAKMLPRLSEPKVVGTGRTISNEFQVSELQLRGVMRIGEHEIADPTIRFNPIHDNINLGAGFLKDYSVTFDQKNRRVRLIGRDD